MIKAVRLYGDQVLKERCGSCEHFYEYYQQVAQDMLDTMISHDGVGLASNQIGLSLRLMVFENKREYVAIRNPIVEVSGSLEYDDEGCLSLPTLSMPVARHRIVRVRGTTPGGEPIRELLLQGYPARVVQHELDHLNGLSIFEATRPVSRNVNKKRWLKRYPRLRKWWDHEYRTKIDEANEKLQAERDRGTPRIIIPGDESDVTHIHKPGVGGKVAPESQHRGGRSVSRVTRRRPDNFSGDGGYT